jgi:precorrin-3B synthase
LTRIVAARDGGLCRVKLPGGVLGAQQALAIAEAADAFASGIVELTNRANLQLRGVRGGHENELSRRLAAAHLGPRIAAAHADAHAHDPQQAAIADDIRNLLLSPTAGIDAYALHDTQPLADEILALLQNEPRFAALSPKFSVLLDGGERLAALDHPHDVWFAAMGPQTDDGCRFALGLAGAPGNGNALAAVAARDVPAMVIALLQTFIDLATPDEHRMRDLLRRRSAAPILERAASRARIALRSDAPVRAWRRTPAEPARRFGAWPQRGAHVAEVVHVGAQPPLGRIDTDGLRALARLADDHGNGTLRLTPWQGVLIPYVPAHAVSEVERAFASLGFALDAHDPLARLIACAGSSGCAKGLADTKADALALAKQLPDHVDVHLSGCLRSCAAAHCAPYTLLAVAPGRYDLYRRASTRASGTSAPASRFGECIGTHLTIDAAAHALGAAARSLSDD